MLLYLFVIERLVIRFGVFIMVILVIFGIGSFIKRF